MREENAFSLFLNLKGSHSWQFRGGLGVQIRASAARGMGSSLAVELRSHTLHGMAKKKYSYFTGKSGNIWNGREGGRRVRIQEGDVMVEAEVKVI